MRARLYVSVKDSGCGMRMDDQLKLFKDFTTLKSNAHLNPNGVGLGLSICKKICTLLEGDIWVDSKLGHGSTFTYYVSCDILDEGIGGLKYSQGTGSGTVTGGNRHHTQYAERGSLDQ